MGDGVEVWWLGSRLDDMTCLHTVGGQPSQPLFQLFRILILLPTIVASPFVHKPIVLPRNIVSLRLFAPNTKDIGVQASYIQLESHYWTRTHCTRSHAHHAPQLLELRRAHAC